MVGGRYLTLLIGIRLMWDTPHRDMYLQTLQYQTLLTSKVRVRPYLAFITE